MANYKLQKVRNEEGEQTDAKGRKVMFYRGAENRVACGQDKYGARTGLSKEQEAYYEKELNLENGKLNRSSSFWEEWCVKVTATGKVFNDEFPKDALDLIVLKQRAIVGLTLEDAKNPEIQYILTSEDHDAKVAIDARSYKKKAFAHFGNMSDGDMRDYLLATGRRIAGMSQDAVESLVGDDVEMSPKKFLEVVNDEDKDLKVFIQELTQQGLITKDATSFRDAHTKDILGFKLETVVEYLRVPENQPYYISMQKELAKKKKAK